MNWYYGPTDYDLLKTYDRNLEDIVALGWGIFGWINRHAFIPMFSFLITFIEHGWAIILFTVLIKLAMSPILINHFVTSKNESIEPEINELGEKFSKDPMKSSRKQ
jgi:YidC/Oxa1 family membrane protein insertase